VVIDLALADPPGQVAHILAHGLGEAKRKPLPRGSNNLGPRRLNFGVEGPVPTLDAEPDRRSR
jgi:hypothetical protein